MLRPTLEDEGISVNRGQAAFCSGPSGGDKKSSGGDRSRKQAWLVSDTANHPIAGVTGGFAKPLTEKERLELVQDCQTLLDFSCFTLEYAKEKVFSKYLDNIQQICVINTGFLGTVDDNGALNIYDGKLQYRLR